MGGHTVGVAYVGPEPQVPPYKGWKVMLDNVEILAAYPSSYVSTDRLVNATFDAMDPTNYAIRGRSTIGTAPGLLPSYVFELGPEHDRAVQIYLLPGPDLCNVVITMKRIPDQDGFCGNFNCNT